MSDEIAKVQGAVPGERPDTAPVQEAPDPREDGLDDNASAWGSPCSAVEAGWDGEEPYQPKPACQDGEEPYPPASAKQEGEEPYQSADGGEGTVPPPPPPAASTGTSPEASSGNSHDEQPAAEERPMTLMEHLGELRVRLVRACIAIGVAFCATYSFAEELFQLLCKPVVNALPPGSKLIFTALPEAFFVHLQVGLVAAIFVACPYIFYQIWCFISPGLYEEEKKYMLPIAGFSAIFFITGAAFCYLVVFPFAFTFFMSYASESIAAMPSLKEYLGFALKLLIAFGLIFEMPLFAFFLARMGVITADLMRKVRRYAVLVIFIVAAILTPPDVISQLLMAMPMLLLYECSIWVAAAFGKKPKVPKKEQEHSEETSAA